jgi:hypothetical protein
MGAQSLNRSLFFRKLMRTSAKSDAKGTPTFLVQSKPQRHHRTPLVGFIMNQTHGVTMGCE